MFNLTYLAAAEVWFIFTSSFRKLGLAVNLEYLCQFFINFNNQWQLWNPHDKQTTNLSLIFKFNKLIFEKYHLSLTSNILVKNSSNWACRGCLIEMKITDIWTFCSKNCFVHHQSRIAFINLALDKENHSIVDKKNHSMFYKF